MEIINQIAPQKFLNPDYIFEKTPPADSSYIYLAILFGLMTVLAGVSWFIYGRKKKRLPLYRHLQTKVFNLFFYTGLSGLVLVFFRWQQITYLGSRFFMLVLVIVTISWAILILMYRLRTFPKLIKEYEQKQKFDKYLPSKRQLKERV